MCFDVGDVGHPDPINCIDFKLPIQGIVSDDGLFAAIAAWTAFITNLRCDACKAGQTCDTVLGTGLPSITKIAGQLTIAIDFPALCPCLVDKLCLARIFPRTLA